MKLCKDCKFFNGSQAVCANSNNTKTNYVTGEKVFMMFPQDLRELESYCSPDAKWFESSDVPQ